MHEDQSSGPPNEDLRLQSSTPIQVMATVPGLATHSCSLKLDVANLKETFQAAISQLSEQIGKVEQHGNCYEASDSARKIKELEIALVEARKQLVTQREEYETKAQEDHNKYQAQMRSLQEDVMVAQARDSHVKSQHQSPAIDKKSAPTASSSESEIRLLKDLDKQIQKVQESMKLIRADKEIAKLRLQLAKIQDEHHQLQERFDFKAVANRIETKMLYHSLADIKQQLAWQKGMSIDRKSARDEVESSLKQAVNDTKVLRFEQLLTAAQKKAVDDGIQKLNSNNAAHTSEVTKLKEEKLALEASVQNLTKIMRYQKPLLDVGISIRRRYMEWCRRQTYRPNAPEGNFGLVDHSVIVKGNMAAHRGDVEADGALFLLNILNTQKDQNLFHKTYRTQAASHHIILPSLSSKPLIDKATKEIRIVNLCGTLAACLPVAEAVGSEGGPARRFYALFRQCREVWIRMNKEKPRPGFYDAFEADEEVEKAVLEMQSIVDKAVDNHKRH